ncbi:hypothetical protein BJ875DRAFT_485286 [Amylocarpus encephaloides]|uniref:Uncharacterized protein n=1 Tax=Amylocarpus encephaloides TaxID=45428 RepID=A0A9P7YGL8_9HELO|nr:hypothetical protein BJ875DRAFT_485286 [Amylocarpus encephaloides]
MLSVPYFLTPQGQPALNLFPAAQRYMENLRLDYTGALEDLEAVFNEYHGGLPRRFHDLVQKFCLDPQNKVAWEEQVRLAKQNLHRRLNERTGQAVIFQGQDALADPVVYGVSGDEAVAPGLPIGSPIASKPNKGSMRDAQAFGDQAGQTSLRSKFDSMSNNPGQNTSHHRNRPHTRQSRHIGGEGHVQQQYNIDGNPINLTDTEHSLIQELRKIGEGDEQAQSLVYHLQHGFDFKIFQQLFYDPKQDSALSLPLDPVLHSPQQHDQYQDMRITRTLDNPNNSFGALGAQHVFGGLQHDQHTEMPPPQTFDGPNNSFKDQGVQHGIGIQQQTRYKPLIFPQSPTNDHYYPSFEDLGAEDGIGEFEAPEDSWEKGMELFDSFYS